MSNRDWNRFTYPSHYPEINDRRAIPQRKSLISPEQRRTEILETRDRELERYLGINRFKGGARWGTVVMASTSSTLPSSQAGIDGADVVCGDGEFQDAFDAAVALLPSVGGVPYGEILLLEGLFSASDTIESGGFGVLLRGIGRVTGITNTADFPAAPLFGTGFPRITGITVSETAGSNITSIGGGGGNEFFDCSITTASVAIGPNVRLTECDLDIRSDWDFIGVMEFCEIFAVTGNMTLVGAIRNTTGSTLGTLDILDTSYIYGCDLGISGGLILSGSGASAARILHNEFWVSGTTDAVLISGDDNLFNYNFIYSPGTTNAITISGDNNQVYYNTTNATTLINDTGSGNLSNTP